MKINFILLLPLVFSIYGNAQTLNQDKMQTIHLWPNEVPSESEAKHTAVKTGNTSNNVIRLTDVTDPILEVFEPNPKIKNGVSIVVCPGGGYNILAIDKEGYEVAAWLTNLGYTAFILQYRVPKKKEAALMDVQRALRIVRSKLK